MINDPLVGRTVAQYDILARVGGGAMGVVYRARDRKLSRIVALKFLPQQWSHDETAKQRFVREAQAASATNHPNICTIHDIETADDGQLFIVMAYYDGPTLKQRLESGALPVEEALEVATQVADGLAKAHAQGVVHRDIKPGNLILTEEGVRILDFGLATFADALKLTTENATLGTPAYMSPEQVRGVATDPRTDVWAAGVVLYEMLAGHVPFQGSHAEAIGHAVRNEAPAALRTRRPDVPEEVEQLVFRALHKDPSVRYQSGRELARALRQVRGLSVPIDLRTEPVIAPIVKRLPPPIWSRANRWITAAAMVGILAAIGWWFRPIYRTPLVVVPVANQTGYAILDPYRLALTHTLVLALTDSPNLSVVGWTQLVERLRGPIAAGADVSRRDLLQPLSTENPDALVLVPTLLYENGMWRGRIEIQSAATGTRVSMIETEGRPSSLPKDVAYDLVGDLAEQIQKHFAKRLLSASYRGRPAGGRFVSLDAARAYEEGIRQYEELEYARAQSMFAAAAEADPRNPLPLAWLSRAWQSMGRRVESREAAERATSLVNDLATSTDRAFVGAVVAEARRDQVEAGRRYQELADTSDRQSPWISELGAWLDRSGENERAVLTYHKVLSINAAAVRPHLELCRIYGPSRLNQMARAEEHGRIAQVEYRRRGDRALEAQALLCLTDVLRMGDDRKRQEAHGDADTALRLLEDLPNHDYALARAHNYVALAAEAQGDTDAAVRSWERALTGARAVGNAVLEPLVLMNLGVSYESMGNRFRALEYHQESIKVYERLGDEQRAAEHLANVGSILIEYGGRPAEGLRDIQNALTVSRAHNNKDFEAYCLRAMAWHQRNAGQYIEAEQLLSQALSIAREQGFLNEIAPLTIDQARSRFEAGDYGRARDLLGEVAVAGSGPDYEEAAVRLASVLVRLGDSETATAILERASGDVEKRKRGLLPVLHLTRGAIALGREQVQDARAHFQRAAQLWTDGYPDPASVEASAYLGMLDGVGRHDARTALETALAQAEAMGIVGLETRVRLLLAQALVEAQRGQEAAKVLANIQEGPRLAPELIAHAYYWRGRAVALQGDVSGARQEMERARMLIDDVQTSLPTPYREGFASRPDVRRIRDRRSE